MSWLLRAAAEPTLSYYQSQGGYEALKKALRMSPQEVVEEVKRSGLRGRGGAGFPTGMKWAFAKADPKEPRYLVANADEGEPGTFKDRFLMERTPHLLLEGMVIAAWALAARQGFIYLRGEYTAPYRALQRALQEARQAGFLGRDILGSGLDFDILVHRGAGAYICGEETALLESLEGRRGQPRIKPPFPVNQGLWGQPTVVNNVETLANVPLILQMGAEAWSRIGSRDCPGPKLYSVSGQVLRPGLYELPMGSTLRELIYGHAGGLRPGRALKAVIPGGISSPALTPQQLDVPMDFPSLQRAGSMLGSGAVMVLDDTVCMVGACLVAMEFFERQSCGKCTPCREGTGWLRAVLQRLEEGRGSADDLELLSDVARNIAGKSFCPLGDGAAVMLLRALERFGEEFQKHTRGRCPLKDRVAS
jgi:NADH-quinone oxidoreductase subunit F